MFRVAKLSVLWVSKLVGLFALCRVLNRRAVRIICYHGFALVPEQSGFRSKLFMDPGDFARRMAWVKRKGFHVVSLDSAARQIEVGEGPDDAVVITMDDGFHGVHRHAAPALERLGLPATIYVTTYYVDRQEPLFNLLVQYVFWRKSLRTAELSGKTYDQAALIAIGEEGANRRATIARQLCATYQVDFDRIVRERWFHLMTREEIADLTRRGFDIQLHTHRHRWGKQTMQERAADIRDNAAVLSPLVRRTLNHFCYPSGSFEPDQWPLLRDFGIRSAVTTQPGFNRQGTPLFRLRRFLDGSDVTLIEFEAEMCGFTEIVARLAARLRVSSLRECAQSAPA